jgi:DNA-binding beta-propeller fold protein YncE
LKRIALYLSLLLVVALIYAASCTHPAGQSVAGADGNYPTAIANILIAKCAVSGCHNAASYQNANGLLLDTWEHLFDGGASGAAIIAYSPKFSPLLYFVNTDSNAGPVAHPRMPLSSDNALRAPLSKDEYNTLVEWVTNGAPDKNGNIPFAANAAKRQKIYMAQQGCDLIAVIDGEKNVVMRYIPVGVSNGIIESPHCIRVSSDGAYAYVSLMNGDRIQKIDTRTDELVSTMNVGTIGGGSGGSWNIVHLAADDTTLIATNWRSNGCVALGNANTMQPYYSLSACGSSFVYPHGITANATHDTIFVTAQYGNVIYKYSPQIPYYKQISLNGNPPQTTGSSDNTSPNPHEIIMSPGGTRYFVTCQGTNEVRVMDARKDTLIATIPVGTFPQEVVMSHSKPYLFVTCTEDAANPSPGRKGSVYVINYNTLEVVSILYGDFYQPHAIAVDDPGGKIYVVSTNASPTGPAPHHATACSGRAGWYTIYDLNTLQPYNSRRYQVTVLPYAAAARFIASP